MEAFWSGLQVLDRVKSCDIDNRELVCMSLPELGSTALTGVLLTRECSLKALLGPKEINAEGDSYWGFPRTWLSHTSYREDRQ